jgi:integrase
MENSIVENDKRWYNLRRLRIEKNEKILKCNRELLSKYLDSKIGVVYATRNCEVRFTKILGENLKVDFHKVTDDDLNAFFSWIEGKYAPRSYNDWIDKTRRFFKWFYDKEGLCYWCGKTLDAHVKPCLKQLKYPKPVDHLKKRNGIKPIHQAVDLLSHDEVNEILDACENIRQRCYFHILWETGFRPRELCLVDYESVKPKDEGFLITLRYSKTDVRTIWLLESRNDLDLLLKQHPYKAGPLFWHNNPKKKGIPLFPKYFAYHLLKLQKNTNIKKPLQLYLFRKSRATLLAKKGWNQSQIEKYMGWSAGSPVLSTYIRLAEEDIYDRQRQDAGLRPKEEEQSPMIRCPWCESINERSNTLCFSCKRSMDAKQAIEKLENQNSLAQNILRQLIPAVQSMINKEILNAKKTPVGEIEAFTINHGKLQT